MQLSDKALDELVRYRIYLKDRLMSGDHESEEERQDLEASYAAIVSLAKPQMRLFARSLLKKYE